MKSISYKKTVLNIDTSVCSEIDRAIESGYVSKKNSLQWNGRALIKLYFCLGENLLLFPGAGQENGIQWTGNFAHTK